MTPKQSERIHTKIKKIKSALAADKKRWGGFHHDGGGLRYLPPALFIKVSDFTGGLRYFSWFNKNFPDDSCYPDFYFEWAIVLFMSGNEKSSELKIFETFCANTYVLDKYFELEIQKIDKNEFSNLEKVEYCEHFIYSHSQIELSEFTKWLKNVIETEQFKAKTKKFIELNILLKNEKNLEKRREILEHIQQLKS